MSSTGCSETLAAFERSLARDLLRSVSRSFYFSLRLLPSPVRGPMSLAYLLARASDSLADTTSRPVADRRADLEAFRSAISTEPPALGQSFAAGPDHTPGERQLLTCLPDVVAWLADVPQDERTLIRNVLDPIVTGQTEDLDRQDIDTDDELLRYTWQVAGCVGDFWTRLCALKLPHFSSAPLDRMLEWGAAFGRGLQLVNILRDVPKDAALGRRYLPHVAEQTADAHWAAAQPWIVRCRDSWRAGLAYAAHLRSWRLRFTVLLPARLLDETLALIEKAGPAAMEHPVKVPRRRMKWILLQEALHALAPARRFAPASVAAVPKVPR